MKNVAPNPLVAFVTAAREALDALAQIPIGAAADEIVNCRAYEQTQEVEGLAKLAKRTGVAVKVGRSYVARRSDLLALIDRLREQQASRRTSRETAPSYAALVATAKRKVTA
jgi:hypothetical protein